MTVTLLIEPAELDASELVVEGDAYQHLFRAARVATGDVLRVVDGRGRAREGRVVLVERRRATVALGAGAPPREPRLLLELLVAAPRPSRASWLVEKGTEVGVRAFRFLECERSARSLDGADLERLRRVARAAVEQCGRAWLPEVTSGQGVAEALAAHGGERALVLDPAARASLAAVAGGADLPSSVVVGPEGGFTPGELDSCVRGGAVSARLVPAVLRVETAALAAASCLILSAER